jgi:hypothetical protein
MERCGNCGQSLAAEQEYGYDIVHDEFLCAMCSRLRRPLQRKQKPLKGKRDGH